MMTLSGGNKAAQHKPAAAEKIAHAQASKPKRRRVDANAAAMDKAEGHNHDMGVTAAGAGHTADVHRREGSDTFSPGKPAGRFATANATHSGDEVSSSGDHKRRSTLAAEQEQQAVLPSSLNGKSRAVFNKYAQLAKKAERQKHKQRAVADADEIMSAPEKQCKQHNMPRPASVTAAAALALGRGSRVHAAAGDAHGIALSAPPLSRGAQRLLRPTDTTANKQATCTATNGRAAATGKPVANKRRITALGPSPHSVQEQVAPQPPTENAAKPASKMPCSDQAGAGRDPLQPDRQPHAAADTSKAKAVTAAAIAAKGTAGPGKNRGQQQQQQQCVIDAATTAAHTCHPAPAAGSCDPPPTEAAPAQQNKAAADGKGSSHPHSHRAGASTIEPHQQEPQHASRAQHLQQQTLQQPTAETAAVNAAPEQDSAAAAAAEAEAEAALQAKLRKERKEKKKEQRAKEKQAKKDMQKKQKKKQKTAAAQAVAEVAAAAAANAAAHNHPQLASTDAQLLLRPLQQQHIQQHIEQQSQPSPGLRGMLLAGSNLQDIDMVPETPLDQQGNPESPRSLRIEDWVPTMPLLYQPTPESSAADSDREPHAPAAPSAGAGQPAVMTGDPSSTQGAAAGLLQLAAGSSPPGGSVVQQAQAAAHKDDQQQQQQGVRKLGRPKKKVIYRGNTKKQLLGVLEPYGAYTINQLRLVARYGAAKNLEPKGLYNKEELAQVLLDNGLVPSEEFDEVVRQHAPSRLQPDADNKHQLCSQQPQDPQEAHPGAGAGRSSRSSRKHASRKGRSAASGKTGAAAASPAADAGSSKTAATAAASPAADAAASPAAAPLHGAVLQLPISQLGSSIAAGLSGPGEAAPMRALQQAEQLLDTEAAEQAVDGSSAVRERQQQQQQQQGEHSKQQQQALPHQQQPQHKLPLHLADEAKLDHPSSKDEDGNKDKPKKRKKHKRDRLDQAGQQVCGRKAEEKQKKKRKKHKSDDIKQPGSKRHKHRGKHNKHSGDAVAANDRQAPDAAQQPV